MSYRKIFSFNEMRDAEFLMLKGFENGKINYSDMYLVAKYLRTMFGYGAVRLERELISFCKRQNPSFNSIVEAEYIRRWVSSAMTYGLRETPGVVITDDEIKTLKSISNSRDRKLLFVTLVLSKALKNSSTKKKNKPSSKSTKYYIRYNNLRDVIQLARTTQLGEIALVKIYSNYKKLFEFSNPERELIQIKYACPGAVGIPIEDPSKLLDYYTLLLGKVSTGHTCARCGKEIQKTGNRKRYCKKCALEIKQEKNRNWRKTRKIE